MQVEEIKEKKTYYAAILITHLGNNYQWILKLALAKSFEELCIYTVSKKSLIQITY
jgi:hypothetical protein